MVINDRILRSVLIKAQAGAVSTSDIVGVFMSHELYKKIYFGLGSGKKSKAMRLSASEIESISYAITAMANTFLTASRYIPKVKPRKFEV